MNTTSLAIERAILSTIIFEVDVLEEIIQILHYDDFYLKANQEIYKALLELSQEELPLEETFILKKSDNGKRFRESDLIEVLSTSAITNIIAYTKELKEISEKRKLDKELLVVRSHLNEDENVLSTEVLQQLEDVIERRKENITTRFNPKKMDDVENKEIEYWNKNWLPLPKNVTAMLTAHGGTGKTFTTLQLVYRIAKEHNDSKILVWFSEDPLNVTKLRTKQIHSILNCKNMDNIDFLGSETLPFHVFSEDKKLKINETWYEFKAFAKNYDVIIIDPLIAFYGGEENSNSQARYFMNILNQWCIKENKTIFLIHHSAKGSNDARGASAFKDAARVHYSMSIDEDEVDLTMRKFEFKKDNWNIKSLVDSNPFKRKIFSSTNKQVKKNINTTITQWDMMDSVDI